MPDEADDFLRKWGGGAPAPAAPVDEAPWPRRYRVTRPATSDGHGGGSQFSEERDFASQADLDAYMKPPAAPAAAPPDEADAFLSKWGSAPPATPAPAAPAGASGHLASTADFSGKPPVMSGAFRPSLGPPDRGGVSLGEAAKTAAATLGGGILDVGDRYTGKIQEAVETGFEHLPIGGQGAYLPDLSREGLTWEERLRTAGGPRETPRPVSEMADAINRGLGTGAPTVAQTKTALRKDPSVDLGFKAEEAAAPTIGDTALMLTGGGATQRGLTATKAGTALAGTRAGRGLLGIGAFGGGGVLVDPEHPKEAIVNGALSYVGMKAGEFVAAPFLAGIMSRAEKAARGVNPTFIKALSGIGEGVGQSLAPQVHDGEWRSALLEGDATTVATNLALNAIFTAGAPDIPLGVKQAYIKGRAGEVPPQYRARLDALAGPIYDSARSTAAEAAKAKAGAKPWTAGDEAAARAEIHAQGATGKAAEAQLAKAKRNTYDADLVTPEMLAEGKVGSTREAADALLGRDRADFAANAQARAEQGLDPKAGLVAGKRETEALEMGEAAAAGQATREAARDSVEPGLPGMLSRPLGEPATAPERAPVPEAPPAAPVAPEPAAAPAEAPAGARESAPVPASAPEAPGHVRLYRGEPADAPATTPSDKSDVGRWFSPDASYAKSYGGRVKYVDVPRAEYEQMVRNEAEHARTTPGMARKPDNVMLDADVAGAAKDLSPTPTPALAPIGKTRDGRRVVTADDLPDAKGAADATWYHGTGAKGLRPDTLDTIGASDPRGLVGMGLYLTDSPEIAGTYAAKRGKRTGTPTTYEAKVNPRAVLNFEKPLPKDAADAIQRMADGMESVADGAGQDVRAAIEGGASGMDVYKAFRDALASSQVPVSEAAEPLQNLQGALRDLGYDAISHIGGTRAGKGDALHRVLVVLDPNYGYSRGGKWEQPYANPITSMRDTAHPGEVAEARAGSEIVQAAPVKEGEVVQRPGSVLDAAERAGIPGAKEARENLDSLPDSTTRWDPVEKRWTRDPVEPAIEGAFQPPAPKTRAFGRKSAATLEAEATKNAGLAQLVRREGGIDLTGTNLTGEVNGLRLKESGTTGLVAPKGGGRSKSVQRLMDAAREEGFDLDGWSETKFVESVLSDAQGDRTLNPAMVDSDQLAEASVRGRDEAETARWEEEQARQKAPVQAGETVYGITRDGMFAQGTVVRETAKSVIVDTPNGQRSIPKTDVQRPPRGIYMGSGFGGAQQFAEAVGPAIAKGAKALGRYSQAFADWARMRTAPKMARSAPEASQYAGGIVNSHTTSKMVAPVWLERVFGENPSPEAMAKFGHAAGEWQFTAKKKALQAQLDATTDPVARGRIEDKLDRVGTVVGGEGSPFATQADLDAYMATPEWKKQSEAWREMWNKAEVVDGADLPGPERMYTDLAKKGDSDPELFTSDDRDVLRVNMKPMEPDAEGGTRPVYRTATGSLRAPILKGHAFSSEFSGGAAKYDFDPGALIENTYQRVHAEWLKPQMYDALVRAGDAEYNNPKDPDWKPPTKIKGEDVAKFTIVEPRTILKDGKAIHVPGKTLYVKESLQGELNQTLRTAPAAKQVLPIRVINTAALTGIADNMWNLMLDAQIPASAPGHIKGRVGNQLGLANNIVGLLKQIKYTIRRPKDYNARALRLAADASWRGAREGEAWTKDYVLSRLSDAKNPLKIPGIAFEATAGGLSKIAQRVHEAGRLVLDEAFTNLVNAGLVRNGPTDRREFVNRLGQYAGRAMDRVTEMARDLGIQPFVVAKKKSLAEIGRKVTFSPGTAAASKGKALEMRVGQLMKWLSFAAASGMVNYAYTGSVTGRPGTPLGNIDTGSDDPKTGVPQSWPWFGDVTGFGPALRASGAAGAFKAKQEGLTDAQAAGDAAMGPMNAVVLKWLSSPTMDFGSRLIAGETIPQALGGGGGPKAQPPQPGENPYASRAGFALREGAQLGGVATQAADAVLGTSLTPKYEQDPTGEFFDLLKSFAPKRGTSPEILADMREIRDGKAAGNWAEWAALQRRNFPSTDAWWAWVEKEVGGTNWPERARYYTLQTLSRKRGK